MRRKDLYIAPALEAALILIVSLVGWASHQPLVFASLGPTAYELIETPERKTARPYNIIAGNIIAILAAFLALWLTQGWDVPSVSSHGVPFPRVWSCAIAVLLTVWGTLLAKATQPAAVATTLLISAGIMQTWMDAAMIMAGVLLIALMGEPIRLWRLKDRQE